VFKSLRYWRLPVSQRPSRASPGWKKIARVELHDGVLLDVSRQSSGPTGKPRLYTLVPEYGTLQCRNLKSLLAELALIDESREMNNSARRKIQSAQGQLHSAITQLREQDGLLQETRGQLAEKDDHIAELKTRSARLREELAAALAPRAEGSTQLRNDVRLVRPELATELGVPAAMLLQQLWFLLRIGMGRIIDGQRHITNTYGEWADKYFPFYSAMTIERAFTLLEKEKLVASKQADGRDSRVKSYRLTPEGIKMMASGENKASKRGDATHQNDGGNPSKRCLPSPEESDSYTSTAAAAAAGELNDTAWFVELARKHGFYLEAEWRRYRRKCKKLWDREPSRRFFEESWVPNIEQAAHPKIEKVKGPAEIKSTTNFNECWNEWWAMKYENPCPCFADAPAPIRSSFLAETKNGAILPNFFRITNDSKTTPRSRTSGRASSARSGSPVVRPRT